MTTIIHRQAVRAILFNPANEVLLIRIRLEGAAPFWIAPGGGREPGENDQQCLRRELSEELGLTEFTIGPLLWTRQHTFNWRGKRLCQSETYLAVHTEHFAPHMSDEVELEVFDSFRWWPAEELRNATEPLTPLSLAQIVGSYLRDGAPVVLPEREVLVD